MKIEGVTKCPCCNGEIGSERQVLNPQIYSASKSRLHCDVCNGFGMVWSTETVRALTPEEIMRSPHARSNAESNALFYRVCDPIGR